MHQFRHPYSDVPKAILCAPGPASSHSLPSFAVLHDFRWEGVGREGVGILEDQQKAHFRPSPLWGRNDKVEQGGALRHMGV